MKEIFENIKFEINYYFKQWFKYPYYNLINGIKNLIYYFPAVWKDRDYDWLYIFLILEAKLKKHLKRLENNQFYVGQEKDEKIIKICIELLHRISEENYMFVKNVNKLENLYNKNKLEIENMLQKRDEELLYKLLKENLKNWWD
jgi:hypothetical protein